MSHGGMLALGSAAPSPVRQTSGAGRLPGAATAGDGGKVFPTLIVLTVCWPGVMEPAAALIGLLCPSDVSQFMLADFSHLCPPAALPTLPTQACFPIPPFLTSLQDSTQRQHNQPDC